MQESDIRLADERERFEFAKQMYKAAAPGFESSSGVLDFFEAPWKWAKEFELWSTLDRPHEGDPNWERFCGLVWRGDIAVREALHELSLT